MPGRSQPNGVAEPDPPDGSGRYAAVDVHYPPDGGAVAAAVLAGDARFAVVVGEHLARLTEVAEYRPGNFYVRELPALDAVLALVGRLDLLIVDGYVDLDPSGRPGLGSRVHARWGIPVVGVAKTAFRPATHAIEVRRGDAARPLYVTAAGLRTGEAAELVRRMAGPFRLPDALRRVDRLARTGIVGPPIP